MRIGYLPLGPKHNGQLFGYQPAGGALVVGQFDVAQMQSPVSSASRLDISSIL